MAVERTNPLPPNRIYLVEVSPDSQEDFREWLSRYKGAVKVKSTTREPMETGLLWDSSDYLDKYIFEVTAPLVFWDGPGFPTIGENTIEYENYQNVITGKTPKAVESEAMKTFKKGAWVIGGVLAGVVAVHAFVSTALPKLILRKT
jgi:hypothetical protein